MSRLLNDAVDLGADAGRRSIHCGTANRLQSGHSRILVRHHCSVNTHCLKAPENLGLHKQDRIQLFVSCGHVVSPSVRSVETLTVATDGMALYCTQVDHQRAAATTQGARHEPDQTHPIRYPR